MKLSEFKNYVGDVNLEYGGLFIDPSDFRHGYANCLRVSELPIDGCVIVERITVYFDNPKHVKGAYESCGTKKPWGKTSNDRKLSIIEMCAGYGYYDRHGYDWLLAESDSWASREEMESWSQNVIRLTEDQTVFDYLYNEGFLGDYE